ncbi:hypothetical protein, partial [Burkholderia sp. PU8-34]
MNPGTRIADVRADVAALSTISLDNHVENPPPPLPHKALSRVLKEQAADRIRPVRGGVRHDD